MSKIESILPCRFDGVENDIVERRLFVRVPAVWSIAERGVVRPVAVKGEQESTKQKNLTFSGGGIRLQALEDVAGARRDVAS